MVFSLKTRNFTSLFTYVLLGYPVPVETNLLKVSENLVREMKVCLPWAVRIFIAVGLADMIPEFWRKF